MDIGDFIIPILIVGGIIAKWLTSDKERPAPDANKEADEFPWEEAGFDPPPPPQIPPHPILPPPLPRVERHGNLSEALGQKERPRHSEEDFQRPTVDTFRRDHPALSPPRLPEPTPKPKPLITRVEIEYPAFKKAQPKADPIPLSKLLTRPPAQTTAIRRQQHPVATGLPGKRFAQLKDLLAERSSIQNAILLNEILQKPVSMREDT
jgi:hypothetical protein